MTERLWDLNDLGGAAEVADLFGVSPQLVNYWKSERERNGFPEPLVRLRATPVYSLSEILAWRASRG